MTPRERRLMALGLLILLIAAGWFAIVRPLVGSFFDRGAERQRLEETLRRNSRIVAALPIWREAAAAQRRDAARFVIAAPNDSLAAEVLRQRLEHLAAQEGFAVSSVEALPTDSRGRVHVRADLTLALAQLSDALRRLENEGAYVVVDYVSISADKAQIVGHLSPMVVRLELSAAYKPAATQPS